MPSYVGFKAWDMGFNAHLTVIYFGDNADEDTLKEIKKAIQDPVLQGPLWVDRKEIALFGPDEDVPVLKVTAPLNLYKLRNRLEKYSVSQFTEWEPHITLDLDVIGTIHIPSAIMLDRLGIY